MSPRYTLVARRACHHCEYCRAPEVLFNFHFELEHVIPTSHQGADDESNLALSCRYCNLRKSDHRTGVDEATHCVVSLFSPREDRWDEHFQVEQETGEIVGLTAVGRATVNRLDMNAPAQLLARLQWMKLRLYP